MRFSSDQPERFLTDQVMTDGESDAASPQPETVQRLLSPRQAVLGAVALFEINTREEELADMARRASLPYDPDDTENPDAAERLRREWFGFVHGSLVWALMSRATSEAVGGYLSATMELMALHAGYDRPTTEDFVDTTLSGYVHLLVTGEQRKCPHRLLSRIVGENYDEVLSTDQIAFVSGMMAITLCNILDTLDRYSFEAE